MSTTAKTDNDSPTRFPGIFRIHDFKAGAYLPPWNAPNDAVAIRMVAKAANDMDHDFNRYAEDFTLWRVGHSNEETGDIVPEPHVLLAKCFDLITPDDQVEPAKIFNAMRQQARAEESSK